MVAREIQAFRRRKKMLSNGKIGKKQSRLPRDVVESPSSETFRNKTASGHSRMT